MPELEEIRDRYDRANFADGVGVVLIGLPGIEKRLARSPQLNSRAGFVMAHKWREVGLAFSPDDDTAAEALAATARNTGGNFRPVQRLLAQTARILEVNARRAIAKEVVETACESLVIGP